MLCVHAARLVSSRAAEHLDILALGEYARSETIAGSTGREQGRPWAINHQPWAAPEQIRAVMEKTDLYGNRRSCWCPSSPIGERRPSLVLGLYAVVWCKQCFMFEVPSVRRVIGGELFVRRLERGKSVRWIQWLHKDARLCRDLTPLCFLFSSFLFVLF